MRYDEEVNALLYVWEQLTEPSSPQWMEWQTHHEKEVYTDVILFHNVLSTDGLWNSIRLREGAVVLGRASRSVRHLVFHVVYQCGTQAAKVCFEISDIQLFMFSILFWKTIL